jgi:hypothetical protein
MLQLLRRVMAALFGRRSPAGIGKLAGERGGEFFAWFNLVERGTPTAQQDGRMRHGFHPAGSAFQSFVKLDLMVAHDDTILAAQLALDRDFVDDIRNGSYARDVAKSFLAWALRHEQGPAARALIANIANLAASGTPVIVRASAMPAPPPADSSGGYEVFLGQRVAARLPFEGASVALRNTANGRRWLMIDVTVP